MRFMERILVVSSTDKSHTMLAQFLSSCGVQSQLCRAMAGSEARRALVDGEFDLVLVNTPLPDEFGHELALLAAGETTAGVILLAKAEIADSVAEKVEDDGVFVVPKPLSRVLFIQALRMTRAARSRLSGLQNENRRLQNEYRAAQRASDLSFGGNPFEDEIEYSDAVLKPRYRLHRCGLPKERLAIPAQPVAPGRERPLDRKGILSLLLDDRREHTPEQELFLTYVKGLSGVQRIVDGYLGKSQSALVKNLRSNPDSFARTIMQTIYSDARRNGIDHLPSLARELIEPELRRHEAARPKPSSEPKSEE